MRAILVKVAVLVALLLLVVVGMWRCEPSMRPIPEGNSADFWYAACRVQVDSARPSDCTGHTYAPREGWFLYARMHFHGEDVYRVPEAEVRADFPAAVRELEAGRIDRRFESLLSGYREWSESDPQRTDVVALVRTVQSSLDLSSWWGESETGRAYDRERNKAFDKRWDEAKRWHWNVIGEFIFFTGLILLATWPWLRSAPPWRWAVHFALLPLLLPMPYWLGYASWTFTSAGPSGGVLYPMVLVELRGLPSTELDVWIVRKLPKFLAAYSPSPGPMMAVSGMRAVWPMAMLVLGGLLGLAAYEVRTALTVSPEATLSAGVRRWFAKPQAAIKAAEPPAQS